MSVFPQLVWVDSPAALPHGMPTGRFCVLDVAFASLDKFAGTQRFLDERGADLAAWVDHHKHPQWERYAGDPRFVLVPNAQAHACPELVTPQVVDRAGRVERVLAHSDFDGMMSAVNWLRAGIPPYPEANEDARAADSPGRGHHFSERGRWLQAALEEHKERAHTAQRHELLTEVAHALARESMDDALRGRLEELAQRASKVGAQAQALVQRGRTELPGIFVVRHPGNLSSRLKKMVLMLAEERARVGVVVEHVASGLNHVTAATFDERLDLSTVALLPVGRSDYRFVNKVADVEPVLEAISQEADRE